MKLKFWIVFAVATILFSGCRLYKSVEVKSARSSYHGEVEVVQKGEPAPDGKFIGVVYVGDDYLTAMKCDYQTVLRVVKKEAAKIGGNVIHITEHILPTGLMNACHAMKANVYYVER